MKTYSNNKPKVFESIGDGGFRYNYNIKEIEVDRFDIIDNENETNIKQTQWEYDNVIIYPPIDKDKIIRAVIVNTWDSNYENKLVNDYNAISLGLFSDKEANEKLERYRSFLNQRKELKELIAQDYQDYWIKTIFRHDKRGF